MRVRREQGFTLIELLIVVAIISIIAAIAVPGLLRARMTGNETSAIASLKVDDVGAGGLLGVVRQRRLRGDVRRARHAGVGHDRGLHLGGPRLVVAPQKSGYNFTLGAGAGCAAGPNDCNGTATITAYYATAVPVANGTTGTRSFAVNAGNTIWQLTGGAAPTEPFGASATPIQ